MYRQFFVWIFLFAIAIEGSGQTLGIGTEQPEATLHVNGSFMLKEGVAVHGISADTLLWPGSDSLLPTQSAIRNFLESGKWAPRNGIVDSVYYLQKEGFPMGYIKDIKEQDGIAYVLTGFGLWSFDISQPDTLVMLDSLGEGLFDNPAFNMHLRVQGDFAYATSRANNWFLIIDISNPDSLILRNFTSQNLLGAEGFYVDSNRAYVISYYDDNVVVFDISDPDTIATIFVLDHHLMSRPLFAEKTGKYLWITTEMSAITSSPGEAFRFDTSDPDTLILRNHIGFTDIPFTTTASGNRFYVGLPGSFRCFEVQPNSHTMTISQYTYVPYLVDIDAKGAELYVSAYTGFPSQGGDVRSFVAYFDISGLMPELRWVAPDAEGKVCAIDDFRFLSNIAGLRLYELESANENLDLVREADGTMAFRNSPWRSDSLLNVIAEFGYVGIGIDSPEVKLHLKGDQRIDGNHTIEFGADIPGKDVNAAKIGNAAISPDALDISGAGYPGLRGISLFGEDAIDLTGTLHVDGGSVHNHPVFAQMGMHFSDRVGIGTFPNTNQMLLIDDGMHMNANGSTRAGVWFNQQNNVPEHATFIGHRDDQTAGIKTQSGWSLLQSGTTGHFGMGMEPGDHMLSVAGSCKAEYLSTSNVSSDGDSRVTGDHTYTIHDYNDLDNALPQIGYETYTPGTLDIRGSGTPGSQTLFFDAHGGITIDGTLTIAGELRADTIFTQQWSDLSGSLQNGWVNYGNGFVTIAMYKDLTGVVHLRGLIKDGLNQQNTVILNLPADYRPLAGHQIYAVPNGNNTAGRIDVETDGDVVFRGVSNAFISLDGIAFKTN